MMSSPLPVVCRKELLQYDPQSDRVCGYLRKQGSKGQKKWQKRWFWVDIAIEDNANYELSYCDKHSRNPNAKKSLSCAGAKLIILDGKTFSVEFAHYRSVTLVGGTEAEAYRWTASLAHIFAIAELREQILSRHIVGNEDFGSLRPSSTRKSLQQGHYSIFSLFGDAEQKKAEDQKFDAEEQEDEDSTEGQDEEETENEAELIYNTTSIEDHVAEQSEVPSLPVADTEDEEEEKETESSRPRVRCNTIEISSSSYCPDHPELSAAYSEAYSEARDNIIYVPSPERVLSVQGYRYPTPQHDQLRFSPRRRKRSWIASLAVIPIQLLQVGTTFVLFNLLLIASVVMGIVVAGSLFWFNLCLTVLCLPMALLRLDVILALPIQFASLIWVMLLPYGGYIPGMSLLARLFARPMNAGPLDGG